MIRPTQIKAARMLAGFTQAQLAAAAGLSTNGLNNIERGTADPKASTLTAIESACLTEGVEFFEDPHFFGVRVRKDPEVGTR